MASIEIVPQDLIDKIQSELARYNHWVAYNAFSGIPDKESMYFFKGEYEAHDFAADNSSDYDFFNVIYAKSFDDLLKKIIPGEANKLNRADPDANGLYNPDGNLYTDAMIDFIENQQSLNNSKKNFMNQKNYDYLKDQVKFTGFGEGLQNELKEKVEKQTPEFTLSHSSKFGNDTAASTLQFKKSEQSDMYFFNSYRVNLIKENTPDTMEQTFYINKSNNITLKEAYNLMSGRAVNKDLSNKEGQLYNAWLQMDFKETENNGNYRMKQFHQNYGFDLEKELGKHPIKELTNEQDKSRLLDSLQRGNRQSVTFIHDGQEQKHFIEVNPQFKTVNVYDSNMQRLGNRQSKEEKQAQGESSATKQDAKKEKQNAGSDDDGPEMPKASKTRKKKQSHSVG